MATSMGPGVRVDESWTREAEILAGAPRVLGDERREEDAAAAAEPGEAAAAG